MGLAKLYEEICEDNWRNYSSRSESSWYRSSTYPSPFAESKWKRRTSPEPSDRLKAAASEPQQQVSLDEIIECNLMISVCTNQLNAVKELRQIKEPRSYTFSNWMNYAETALSNRLEEAVSYMLDLLKNPSSATVFEKLDAGDLLQSSFATYTEAKASLLGYLIQHILIEELSPRQVDREELINLVDDAAVYIGSVKRAARDQSKNKVFTDYVIDQFNPSIRDDCCCPNCAGDIFDDIPYCLNCNLPISR